MSEEEKSFSVKDRRRFNVDGSVRDDEPGAEESPPPEAEAAGEEEPRPEAGPEPKAAAGGGAEPTGPHRLPPVDFSGLILSLSHAAMMHLGQIPEPTSGQQQMDLGLARHTIDTIAMLKDKTSGNLSPDEQGLIDNVLTELRLAYVHLSKQKQE